MPMPMSIGDPSAALPPSGDGNHELPNNMNVSHGEVHDEEKTLESRSVPASSCATWEFVSIIGHRLNRRGLLEFRINWVQGAPTWEPEENIASPGAEILIRRYKLEHGLIQTLQPDELFPNGDPLLKEFQEWEAFGEDVLPLPKLPCNFPALVHHMCH